MSAPSSTIAFEWIRNARRILEQYEDLYHPAFDAAKADQRRKEFDRLGLLAPEKSKSGGRADKKAPRPKVAASNDSVPAAEPSPPAPDRLPGKKRHNKGRYNLRRRCKAELRKKAS